MMARQNVRLPILTIERVATFFWVSLGLREADTFRAVVVQDFDGVAVQVPPPSTLEAVTATEQALIRPLFGR
jgi:hypothetical protein